jgi:hypothetical protein
VIAGDGAGSLLMVANAATHRLYGARRRLRTGLLPLLGPARVTHTETDAGHRREEGPHGRPRGSCR